MKKSNIIKLVINFALIIILCVGIIIGNVFAEQYASAISTVLSPAIVDEEAWKESGEAGQKMASRVMEEGATLLENENGVLPLNYNTDKKVNVFGWRSVDWIHGSQGRNASGGVASEDGTYESTVDFLESLKDYGIQYNTRLANMYEAYYTPTHMVKDIKSQYISALTYLIEPKISDKNYYTDDLLSYSKNYSDVAIVVISRIAGENMNCDQTKQQKKGSGVVNDNTRHYLEISTEEEELLTYVGNNFEKVIVLLNVANPFECGFMKTIDGLDACMYVGYTGTQAVSVIPKLLYGEVSPSGHTIDTFAYDMYTNPANIFSLPLTYSDYNRNYLDLIEGIYVGYKWYETADAEGYWDAYSNVYGEKYNAVVQYPFGFGLSYNTYEWEVGEISVAPNSAIDDKTIISIPVTITNKGAYAGREVVSAYLTPPYTSGGIEKPDVSLVGFAKTDVLDAGESQTITIKIDAYDFLSYDCYDKNANLHKGYELEAGEYNISLRTDSHTVKSVIYDGGSQNANFTYYVNSTINVDVDPSTGAQVKNLFTGEDALDVTPLDATEKDGSFTPEINWLTRENFRTLDQIKSDYKKRTATPSAKFSVLTQSAVGVSRETDAHNWDDATLDIFGNPTNAKNVVWSKKNNMVLAQNGVISSLGKKLGADYNDSEWEKVLEQLSVGDVTTLINKYYGTEEIASVGKPALSDLDGPSQIKGFSTAPRGTGYPCMVIVASSWNPMLAFEFGQSFGDDMISVGVDGLWGWAVDNHRSAFFGRSFESPSEDAFLAGTIVANAVKGLNTRGRYCFIKHFAFYTTGWNCDSIGNCSSSLWMSEQTLRENSLKAFRKVFVDGGALGCMTSYDGIGAEHAETTEALITGVLRKEWGFNGTISTDYLPTYYSSNYNNYCEAFVRAGGDLGMNVSLVWSGDGTASNRFQNRLKEVAHHVLYTWLRSDYNKTEYEDYVNLLAQFDAGTIDKETYVSQNADKWEEYQQKYLVANDSSSSGAIKSWEWWKPVLYSIDVVAGLCLAIWAEFVLLSVFMPNKKVEKEGEQV